MRIVSSSEKVGKAESSLLNLLDSFNFPLVSVHLSCFHTGPLPAVRGMTGRTNVCSGAITQLGFHTFLSPLNLRPLRPRPPPPPPLLIPPSPLSTFYLLSSLYPFANSALSVITLSREAADNIDLITPNCCFSSTLLQSCVRV